MILDSPPPYDESATGSSKGQQQELQRDHLPNKVPPAPIPAPQIHVSPHAPPSPLVHHYVHPVTGEHIATLLPPDHPEMICLQRGEHVRHTRFGLLGILAAVFFFPLGVAFCLLDRNVKCDRCGRVLEEGVSCG